MSNEHLTDSTLCLCKHPLSQHKLQYMTTEDIVVLKDINESEVEIIAGKMDTLFGPCNHNDANSYYSEDADYCKCEHFQQDNLEVLRKRYEEKKKRDRR